jgi:GT2 family glycosyltransferase
MLISVIIPTLNRPDDLALSVYSVIGQTYLPHELIIVDQSDDNISYDIVSGIFHESNCDINLVYIHDSEISGLVAAKKNGVDAAVGDIISFSEDDEVMHERYLENTVDAFSDENIMGISGIVTNIERNKFYLIIFKIFHLGIYSDPRVDVFKNRDCNGKGRLICSNYISGGISSYRKVVFEKIEFDLKNKFFTMEDIEFSVRAADFFGKNKFFICTNVCLKHYMSPINREILFDRWKRKSHEFILFYKKNKRKKYAFLFLLWLMIALILESILAGFRKISYKPFLGLIVGIYTGSIWKLK